MITPTEAGACVRAHLITVQRHYRDGFTKGYTATSPTFGGSLVQPSPRIAINALFASVGGTIMWCHCLDRVPVRQG